MGIILYDAIPCINHLISDQFVSSKLTTSILKFVLITLFVKTASMLKTYNSKIQKL